MAAVVCSTSIAYRPGPTPVPPLLSQWEELCAGLVDALAIDARNNPAEQKRLLTACAERGIRCVELALPQVGAEGRPAPSLISADPDERHAAGRLLTDTLRLALEHGVPRLILFPALLPLSALRWEQVLQSYACGGSPAAALQALEEERLARAPQALDALCFTLEPALQLGQDLEVELLFPLPGPLPQQLPAAPEVATLLELFAGSRLGAALCTDWIHVLGELRGEAQDLTAQVPPGALRCVRLADACGLTPMLPPGTGEICWPGPLYALEGTREVDQVLAVAPGTSRAELQTSRELLGRILAGGEGA